MSLEKYTELIAEKEYSYIVYFFNQEKEELEIIMQYEGKNNNEIKENRINVILVHIAQMHIKNR